MHIRWVRFGKGNAVCQSSSWDISRETLENVCITPFPVDAITAETVIILHHVWLTEHFVSPENWRALVLCDTIVRQPERASGLDGVWAKTWSRKRPFIITLLAYPHVGIILPNIDHSSVVDRDYVFCIIYRRLVTRMRLLCAYWLQAALLTDREGSSSSSRLEESTWIFRTWISYFSVVILYTFISIRDEDSNAYWLRMYWQLWYGTTDPFDYPSIILIIHFSSGLTYYHTRSGCRCNGLAGELHSFAIH